MQKEFSEDYDFFPRTYMLPYELAEFRNQFVKLEDPNPSLSNKKVKKASTITVDSTQEIKKQQPVFIIKPECMSQGKGIFLT